MDGYLLGARAKTWDVVEYATKNGDGNHSDFTGHGGGFRNALR